MAGPDSLIPVNVAAIRLRQSRERTIREIQRGTLAGDLVPGEAGRSTWVVDAHDLDRAVRERQGVTQPAA